MPRVRWGPLFFTTSLGDHFARTVSNHRRGHHSKVRTVGGSDGSAHASTLFSHLLGRGTTAASLQDGVAFNLASRAPLRHLLRSDRVLPQALQLAQERRAAELVATRSCCALRPTSAHLVAARLVNRRAILWLDANCRDDILLRLGTETLDDGGAPGIGFG